MPVDQKLDLHGIREAFHDNEQVLELVGLLQNLVFFGR